ncbi:MAG: carbohydrate ABC transporter permease [Clostridia bacterium]|nr:carbohydrate ABC transporter permease [Clostridia bacterium]
MKKGNPVFKIISLTVLVVWAAVMLFMLVWGLIASFKHSLDLMWYPTAIFPDGELGWHFENFLTAYQIMYVSVDRSLGVTDYIYFEQMLLNSVVWSVGSAFLNTFTCALVSYCCARFSSRLFSKIIYTVTIVSMTIPIVGSLPSQMQLVRFLGIEDTHFVIPFMKLTFNSSYFLVFYAIFRKLPASYHEAAEIDGAGHWRIFFKIVIPLIGNTFIAVFVLFFISYWNDYQTPMLYMPSYPTISQGLFEFQNSRNKYASDPVKLAACFIVCLPSLVAFLIFREKIMENVAMGGLKG